MWRAMMVAVVLVGEGCGGGGMVPQPLAVFSAAAAITIAIRNVKLDLSGSSSCFDFGANQPVNFLIDNRPYRLAGRNRCRRPRLGFGQKAAPFFVRLVQDVDSATTCRLCLPCWLQLAVCAGAPRLFRAHSRIGRSTSLHPATP